MLHHDAQLYVEIIFHIYVQNMSTQWWQVTEQMAYDSHTCNTLNSEISKDQK